MDAFAGIDLAVRKRKRLPNSVCIWESDRLIPLCVAERGAPDAPRGAGNVAALDPIAVARFADDTAAYLHRLEAHFHVSIRRIAIDAPSDPKQDSMKRRKAEEALDERHISCITTPSAAEFGSICEKAREHLRGGSLESRLPHANQIWMLVGFGLFERLRREWECLEVFPQATAVVLGAGATHKSKQGGVMAQLSAAARHTRWPDPPSELALKEVVHGPAHDSLDAYLSAWVAALHPDDRIALGTPPNDVIWIPSVGTVSEQVSGANTAAGRA